MMKKKRTRKSNNSFGKKSKKAQMQAQIFVYVLTVIVAGIIFMFGFNAIQGFLFKLHQSQLTSFEIDMKNTFSKISSEYDSIVEHEFVLPQKFSEVCFVDIEELDFWDRTSIPYTLNPGTIPPLLEKHPLISHSITSGAEDNVFVYDKLLEKSFFAGNINIINDTPTNLEIICYPLFNGRFNLRIKGLGNIAEIEEI
ncbi:hypothetical protein GOV05_03870 [Candidatus Woesearchaeota archaeon]|nr:hypothetical protein [Candidatus Woesearchaeota archaeon]